jgi:hypothetical protein
MPTNTPDAPSDVLASLDDTTAALQAIKAHRRSGQNTNMLRATFTSTDPVSTPVTPPKAAVPVQVLKAKAAPFAPGL